MNAAESAQVEKLSARYLELRAEADKVQLEINRILMTAEPYQRRLVQAERLLHEAANALESEVESERECVHASIVGFFGPT